MVALVPLPCEDSKAGAATTTEGIAMTSRVKELADKEAAKAEAEPDEPNGDEAGDGDAVEGVPAQPSAEPDGDPTAEDIAALNGEYERHASELRHIMGADFDSLEACDACGGMGYAPPVMFKPNERYKRCETCDGLGNVLTGARIETSATAQCPACQGRGYLEKLNVPAPTGATVVPPANGADEYGSPSWMGSPDVQPQPVYGPPS